MRFAIAASCLFSTLALAANPATRTAAAQTTTYASMSSVPSASVPQEGRPAPSFTLPSQSGSQVSLVSLKGKWVVLYFYPEDFSSGCTLEAHNFQRDAEKYRKLHAVIVGVSVDTVDSHKQFCAKESLNIKLLSDVDRKVLPLYGSLNPKSDMAERNTFLIDPNGKIAKVWIKVSPAQHSAEVLSAIMASKQS